MGQGLVRKGWARHGKADLARRGMAGHGEERIGRQGWARLGGVWPGVARQGAAGKLTD